MGEGKGNRSHAEAEAHNLTGRPQADRGGAESKVGEGRAGDIDNHKSWGSDPDGYVTLLRPGVINLHLQGMSRTRTQYKQHIIQVDSIHSLNQFTVHVDLEKHGAVSEVTHFESGKLFGTDAEALEAGLRMGQQTIDRGYAAR